MMYNSDIMLDTLKHQLIIQDITVFASGRHTSDQLKSGGPGERYHPTFRQFIVTEDDMNV